MLWIGTILSILFQSTLPSQGATIYSLIKKYNVLISIHAPLTGSDWCYGLVRSCLSYFNPRSPHRERRRIGSLQCWRVGDFNPRSPHRERLCMIVMILMQKYFNPRSPHRERRQDLECYYVYLAISIHAPLTGSDQKEIEKSLGCKISIHAPLTGSDCTRG